MAPAFVTPPSRHRAWPHGVRGRVQRSVQRRALALLHARGARRPVEAESADPAIVSLGGELRHATLETNRGVHARCKWRILLCTPPSLAADVWFSDLASGMQHTSLPYLQLPSLAHVDASLLDAFRPNVVIALDNDRSLARLDLGALRRYKAMHGCLRLFIPTRDRHLSFDDRLTEGESRRLQRACDGDGADAFVSLYEQEYFARAHRAWSEAGFPYVSLPQSGNPLEDYPRAGERTFDYFYASAATPERIAATWHELRRIVWGARGDWAGEGWGFGGAAIPFAEMPRRYAGARIALAPLLPSLREHPFELTHRVFEAAASGAFQLTTLSPVTRRYFSAEALVAASDGDDFVRLFRRYLGDREARERHARRALRELYDAHTVFHRIAGLVHALDSLADRC